MTELSVLIVTYNSAGTIESCLGSLHAFSAGIDLEVLLWDNASADATVQKVREAFPRVRICGDESNVGFGRANNYLLEESRGGYVLFLNPDCMLRDGSLAVLLDFVKNRPEVGAAGPRLAFPDGSYQISTASYPGLRNELITKFYYRALDKNFRPVKKYLENRHRQASAVPWVGGACLLCAREKLIRIGGFDPNFFLYFEDIDLCKRLSEQGWKSYYLPEAVVVHQRGASIAGIPWFKELEYRKSELYYYRKHLGIFSFYMLKLYLSLKFSWQWLGWKLRTNLNKSSVTLEQARFYPQLFRLIVQSKYNRRVMAISNRKLRLLLIIDDAKIGGGQRHLLWLAKYLDRQKFNVAVICGGEGYLTQKLKVEEIEHYTLPSKLRAADLLRLRKITQKIKPEIVHTHGTVAGVWGRLAGLGLSRPKMVHTLHGIHYLHFPGSLKKRVGIWSEKILSKFTDKIICVSEADRIEGLAYGLFPVKKAAVIRNAVEKTDSGNCSDFPQIRQKLGLSSADLIIGSVGRLRREKGHIYLLAAAYLLRQELSQAKYIIVGDGPLEGFLKLQAKKIGLEDRVLFLGTREDVPALLRLFDILVLPSLWEGMPLIILEAMQAGKAIIASRIDSVAEIITDQREGIFFSAGSAEELAAVLRELALDPQKRKRLGENARLRAKQFTLEKMIDKYEELYWSLFKPITRP